MEYIGEYLLFRYPEVRIKVIWVGAHVNNAIHIQVEIIELWYLSNANKQMLD